MTAQTQYDFISPDKTRRHSRSVVSALEYKLSRVNSCFLLMPMPDGINFAGAERKVLIK